MHIGIIGAGFTGLSAAIELQKQGHNVTLFERENIPGGLAIGFKSEGWEWSLEKHYHHIFASDKDIQQLAQEIGVKFNFTYPSTSWLIDNQIFRVDSPLRVLTFPKLSLTDRLRMAAVLGLFKLMPFQPWLETFTAHEWLSKWMGKKVYEMFWEPLLTSKFGDHAHNISLAWFWARIKARTPHLGYPEKGFQHLVEVAAQHIIDNKGTIHYSTTVEHIETSDKKVIIKTAEKNHTFDKVIVTLPNVFFAKIAPQLPTDYKKQLSSFEGIGAVNIVLELSKQFFKDNVYWLSICQKEYPFLAVVEQTNYIDKKHYNNHHLVYIGNYVSTDHPYYAKTKEELLQIYDPYLKKLNPDYQKNLIQTYMFKVPFAQPIVSTHFSEKILPFTTPLSNVYLANMQQVYPWDRGTNYAVQLGKRVVQTIFNG